MVSIQELKPTDPELYIISSGGADLERFTDAAQEYRCSKRWQGGHWDASWWLPLDPDNGLDEDYLRDWFNNRLFLAHQARLSNKVVWDGLLWSMELTIEGETERRDVGSVFNALAGVYTNASDNTTYDTGFSLADNVRLYGQRQEIIVKNFVSAAEAAAAVASNLKLLSDDNPQPIGINPNAKDGLRVQAVGKCFTINNRFVTAGDDSTDDMSQYVREIIQGDCDQVTPGNIQSNTLQRRKSVQGYVRAWDALMEMVDAGDGTNPWRLWVTLGRVNYTIADPTPVMFWNGRAGGITHPNGNRSPWLIEPGVLRNLTQRAGTRPSDSFLTDARDRMVYELEMSMGQLDPQVKASAYDPAGLAAAVAINQQWLEDAANE